jgi:hypothetical protein
VGYEIRFWREVTNSHGHPFRVVLARFAVNQSRPSEETMTQATDAFCRMMHVSRWGLVAHGYDIADMGEVGLEGEPCLIEEEEEAQDAPPAGDRALPFDGTRRPAKNAPLRDLH